MRHLGTEPHWVAISNKVEYPTDVSQRYLEIMEKSVKDFETDFSKRLHEKRFIVTNMVIQPRGLTNEKLMCFANSSIQLLFASPHFVSFAYFMKTNLPLFSPRQLDLVPSWRLFCEFLSGFNFSDSATSDGALPSLKSLSMVKTAFPTNLKILDPVFGEFSSQRKPLHQEDAIEFLLYFLNRLHEDLLQLMKLDPPKEDEGGAWRVSGSNRKVISLQETQGDLSPLSDVFATLIRSDTMENGKTRSVNKESLVVLPLPIRGVKSLNEAIDRFTEEEKISSILSKKSKFDSTPKSLIIGLKRFDFDMSTYQPIKLNQIIDYPDFLSIKRAVDSKELQYQLCAVVEHIGKSPDGGHYVCYVRRFDGNWMKFDDDKITPLDTDNHLGIQAYLLLYNQITSTRNE